jgi:hypothetical protein
MSLAVDEAILNNPFEEPKEYWVYKEGHPKRMSGRRPAGYFLRQKVRVNKLNGKNGYLFRKNRYG